MKMMKSLVVGAMMLVGSMLNASATNFELPPLPYKHNALEPVMSQQTVDLHWGKHVQGYINNLNKLIVGTEFEDATLEEICEKSTGAIYNNGAQVWNHILYFNTFSPDAKTTPTGKLLKAIERDFGSFDAFKDEFVAKGTSQFGSGWVWLAKDDQGKLAIIAMSNAENPIKLGLEPILGFDVWEHAYYLDYQNRRADHLKELWKIVDWSAVEERY